MDLLENCSECYQATLSQFPDTITIEAALPANTSFYLWFTDKFGNIFSTGAIQTDSAGTIVVNPANEKFPTGWFCKDAGSFKIEAKPLAPYYSGTQNFTFASVEYPCIWVDFQFNNAPKTVIV